jgi:DNA-binding IclR family transcriptional regulator
MEQRSNFAGGSAQLDRGLDIIELLVGAGTPVGLTAIADRVGGPKATVHRLLATLQHRGYVTRDQRGTGYSAGIRCFELGSSWANNLDLRSTARPSLDVLNETTGETVHLAVYDHGDVVYVEKLDCRHPVVAVSHVGRRCPASCVATGRALLAFQGEAEIAEVLAGPLPQFTPLSTTDPVQLRAILDQVRADGYGTNRGSYREGVGGLAAPVRDHTGQVVASVGVCLPEQRFGEDRFSTLLDAVTEAAVGVSRALGGPGVLVTSGGALSGHARSGR